MAAPDVIPPLGVGVLTTQTPDGLIYWPVGVGFQQQSKFEAIAAAMVESRR